MTKTNTDVSAHWVSKLLERRWQIDVLAGMHNEYFYDRSPNSALNNLNEVQYGGANLWDLEHAAGCQPTATNTATASSPAPSIPSTSPAASARSKKYTAYRWTGEIKSTHIFEAGGHHELKYGWHLELGTFDLNRYYSGPAGDHAFSQIFRPATRPSSRPTSTTPRRSSGSRPAKPPAIAATWIRERRRLPDQLKANVKSLTNAFFLQDS